MSQKLLNPAHEKTAREENVLTFNQAVRYLKISTNAAQKGMAGGWLQPQKRIEFEKEGSTGLRPAIGFEVDYLNELMKILPPEKSRGKGTQIWTAEVKEKVRKINERWPTR